MVKTRFAPSPTGWLHIGGARTALFSWLYARHFGGQFVLRVEDTDIERSTKEFENEILDSMKWLGLDWDQLEYQSKRFDIYKQEAQRLVDEGKAYEKDGAIFIPVKFDEIIVKDLIRGDVKFTELPKDEEVIIKSNGSPAFNFANAVDDGQMGITHVVRGEDHLPNTPKQILMYKALGYEAPTYAHLPMILAAEGGKMSKRHGATAVTEYREKGFMSKAIVNYLLLLGWSPKDDRDIIDLQEAIKIFDLKDINKSGAKFDLKKLSWFNNQYLSQTDTEDLYPMVKKQMADKGILCQDEIYIKKVIDLFKERANFLHEIVEMSDYIFDDEFEYTEGVAKVLTKPMIKEFETLIVKVQELADFSHNSIEAAFSRTAEALEMKVTKVFLPMRTALSGRKGGPGIFEIAEILGKEKTIARMQRLLDVWKKSQ